MAFALRQTIKLVATNLRSAGKRQITMSANLRAEEAIEEMKKKNPYFEKYASKISNLQQTAPEEFLNRLDSVQKDYKPKKAEKPRDYSELLQPKKKVDTAQAEIPYKKLSDIMKLELLEGKSADEIKKIWIEYHKDKDVLIAAIPSVTYKVLSERGKENPLFILPLPRSQGFEFFLLQFSNNTIHFTPLLCYQVHKENAPECLNIVHYTEFDKKLDVVLMRGEYDSKVINAHEAQCLVNQLQLYYCQNDEKKLTLLKRFTREPDSFQHMDVISELENLSIK